MPMAQCAWFIIVYGKYLNWNSALSVIFITFILHLIDYYYLEDEPDEEYEEIKVSDVLLEIEYHNKIIK